MVSRARIRFADILHFVRDLLFPLLKNSKSGSHMIGTTSLAPRWSAPLRDYPGAAPRHASAESNQEKLGNDWKTPSEFKVVPWSFFHE